MFAVGLNVTGVPTSASASVTVAVADPFEVAPPGPVSFTVTVTVLLPSSAYVCDPEREKDPVPPITVASDVVPSPQATVEVNEAGILEVSASENVATVPFQTAPSGVENEFAVTARPLATWAVLAACAVAVPGAFSDSVTTTVKVPDPA
jgi:hypothetical protein